MTGALELLIRMYKAGKIDREYLDQFLSVIKNQHDVFRAEANELKELLDEIAYGE